MYDKGIFVFGSKIFEDEVNKRDAISSLPLELSWKIFSYLDDKSLRVAHRLHKTWARIITANKQLCKRLNHFELAIKLGSKASAKFHIRNMKRLKKEKKINYLSRGETTDHSMKNQIRLKRQGDPVVVYTKRFKLFK